jgi:glycosyltransferase involved in cell wall biosynthesis
MRVLHCIGTMDGGGAERQLSVLAHGLVGQGMELHVAILRSGPNLPRLQASGAHLHTLSASHSLDPLVVERIWRLIKEVQPQLVQTWLLRMDIEGGLATRIARIPWILSEQNSEENYLNYFPWRVRLRQIMGRGARAIVSNSVAGSRYWDKWVGDRVKKIVIRNALPLEEIDAVTAKNGKAGEIWPDKKIVLYAGRFAPQKNVETLVTALQQVLTDPKVMAVLCGDGPLRPKVEQWAQEHGLAERMAFLGYVPEQELWAWMKRAAVFVSVSFHEGQPNAVVEAMACGSPLVVSDISSHREFLDAETAALVNPRDPDTIARAIQESLDDPSLAKDRAAKARVQAAEWSQAGIAAQYAHLYGEIIGG